MLKKTLATAMLTAVTFGGIGVTAASATTAPQQVDKATDTVQQHAKSTQQQAAEALRKLDQVRLPKHSPMKQRVEDMRGQLQMMANQSRAGVQDSPLCDGFNTVLNTTYELLRSLGVPNGPDIGLPDFPNPCKM